MVGSSVGGRGYDGGTSEPFSRLDVQGYTLEIPSLSRVSLLHHLSGTLRPVFWRFRGRYGVRKNSVWDCVHGPCLPDYVRLSLCVPPAPNMNTRDRLHGTVYNVFSPCAAEVVMCAYTGHVSVCDSTCVSVIPSSRVGPTCDLMTPRNFVWTQVGVGDPTTTLLTPSG